MNGVQLVSQSASTPVTQSKIAPAVAGRSSAHRILHVIASSGRYGAESVIATLAAGQREAGAVVSVLIFSDSAAGTQPFADELRSLQVGVELLQTRGALDFGVVNAIPRVVAAFGPTVVHSHGYKADILCSRLRGDNCSALLVSTLHGWTNSSRFSRMRVYQSMQIRALRKFDHVVAVDDSVWLQHPKLSLLTTRAVINNGIARLDAVARQAVQSALPPDVERVLSAPRPILVVIGRLSAEKGQRVAIEAQARLRAQGCDASLVLVGDGPDRGALAELVRTLGLADRVAFTGFVSPALLLDRASLVLVPSLKEGLPMAVLEAMRHGVALVASAVGGIPAVLDFGRSGLIVAPGGVEQLAAATRRLLENDALRASVASAARERFAARYVSDAMVAAYLALYGSREPAR